MSVFQSTMASWILSYLLNSLWQVPLLFAAGWVAARGVRRFGAGAEHRVWVGVLLLQGLLPAASLLPWERVSWQWLRALVSLGRPNEYSDGHVSVVMGIASSGGGIGLPEKLLTAAMLAYGAACLFFIARFFWRARMLATIRRESLELPLAGEAARSWSQCAERFGMENVSIAASSRVFGPVTLGGAKKLVLLPATMVGSLSDVDFDAVIAHEFAHMRRHDFTKNLLYELVSLPVAYHPLLWWTQERITESREMVCDEMAAAITGRSEYARSLLRLASLLVHGAPVRIPHAIGIFDAHTFERRLMKLSGGVTEMRGMRRVTAVAVCAAFGIATCGSALALRMDVSAPASESGSGPAKTPKKVMIASGVMAGNKLSGDNPKYPADAKKAKVQGTVVLEAVISKTGDIENLRVVSGPKELRASSIEAVKTWKYKPYMLNGDDVEVTTKINVTYSLAG